MEQGVSKYAKLLVVALAVVEIATCCLLMSLNPIWNGENPEHRNQYELIADSFIDGSISFEYDDVDPRLAEMDNPYSPQQRRELGVSVHKDHAYYDGKYYMYFGVVPAVTLFVPFKLITGASLTTYHATQLYVALIIVAFYLLFFMLRRRFFPKVPWWLCALAAFAFSFMSTWFAVARSALYCTAITGGVCFMMWSLCFFVRAFVFERSAGRVLAFAAAGAVCGALVFGCRPILGLANFLVVVPLLACFLRRRALSPRATAALFGLGVAPYVLVGAALMAYNAARFGSPFEFGQSYQLTISDQHLYGSQWLSLSGMAQRLPDWISALFGFGGVSNTFPFVQYSGVFVNFPVLLAPLMLLHRPCRTFLRKNSSLAVLVCGGLLTSLATVALDLAWSPEYIERYNMDVYYLLGICSFIAICTWFQVVEPGCFRSGRARCAVGEIPHLRNVLVICVLALTLATSVLLFLNPADMGLLTAYPDVASSLGIANQGGPAFRR